LIVRFVGFGGQGIVLSSYIIGLSAVLDGKRALQNQSYGSESRGGECRGDVIISEDEIHELEPTSYDILVAMTQPGYEKFIGSLKPNGALILDSDLVVPKAGLDPVGIKTYGIRATEIASKDIGRTIVANMVVLGYMNSLLNLVTIESLEKAITENVPKGTEELNLKALHAGIKLATGESVAG
jgi:2-oxoglutarate ferredoxin oxidoreductase subunit gamma